MTTYTLTVLYVIGAEGTAALVSYSHPGLEAGGAWEHPPFAQEMEGMGSAHPDDHMGMPGDMDGLCQWEGKLKYGFANWEQSEVSAEFLGKWTRIYSLEAMINLTGQGET